MLLKKLTQFLVVSVFVVFSSSLIAENIITNGSFEEHGALNHNSWGTFTQIPGWVAESEPFEIQSGNIGGLAPIHGTEKLELDANSNSSAYHLLPTEVDQSYVLKFKYSPRIETQGTDTNKVSVWWDDKKIKTLSGHKRGWRDYSFILDADTENTKLTLKAKGTSDSLGGYIDNVQVFSTSCFVNNEIQNGSFEQYGQLDHGQWGVFTSIPNWDVKSGWIEIQTNNVADLVPVDGIAKVELDSHQNSTIEQTLNDLEEGEQYQLILNYSPRVKNHNNTNKIKLWWNNKKIAVLNGKTKGWVQKTFTVTASSQNKLKLKAIGKDDSLGGLIDNIQLYKLDCQTTNNTPTAEDQTITLDEDIDADVILTGSDPDPLDQLTFSVVDTPLHGALTGAVPNLTYAPETNFHGSDSFTFKVNDERDDSNIATVTIVVNPVNDAPTAEGQVLETNEDTNLPITLAGSDIDEDSLIFEIVQSPAHGTLSGDAPNLTYIPAIGFNGGDSFTYKTNDGQLDSETATVTINVLPINDVPDALGQSLIVNEDESVSVILSGSDIDKLMKMHWLR